MQKLLLYICILFICVQCAQITSLTGGKKDATPPKALSYLPENVSVNFNSKQIVVQFDEYIKLKDIANQFIITPQTREMPDIQALGKTLKITFNEPLIQNATYKLSFGNAIIDLHEGNVLQNFEYVFSTGSTIDSLKLNGQVLNAYTKKPSEKLLIGLYPNNSNDSTVYKDKPLYISKTDEAGMYNFNYLPSTPFKILAIDDVNKNLVYDGSEERIAFQDLLVNPNDGIISNLLLFKELPSKSFIKKSISLEYGKAMIIYNKPQFDIKSVISPNLLHVAKNETRDSLTLYYNNQFDTLQTIISYHSKKTDTVNIKIPSSESVVKMSKGKDITYYLKSNIGSNMPFFISPQFELNFPIDLKNISENKITLTERKDSISINKSFSILKDISSKTTFSIQSSFKPETNYTLTINKGALKDSINKRINDSITYKFTTTSVEDYAQLNLKVFFPKKENYILLLLNDKEQIIQKSLIEISLASTSEKLIEYKNILPGIYFSKIIEDVNKNGKFDTGDYFLHQQPEPVFVNSTPIKLLAGWEIENEWIVK